jgi:hypothetical protein
MDKALKPYILFPVKVKKKPCEYPLEMSKMLFIIIKHPTTNAGVVFLFQYVFILS